MALNLEAFKEYKQEQTQTTSSTSTNSNSATNNSKSTANSTTNVGTTTSPYKKQNEDGPNTGSIFAAEDEGYVASRASEAINHLLESSLFQNVGIKDGASHIDKDVVNNSQWKVDMDVDGDGVIDQGVNLADAIAASFDSELDLYIEDQVQKIMEKYQCYDIKALFGSQNSQAVKDLAALGIRADAVGDDEHWQNRTYAFSLVELPAGFENMTPEEQIAYVYSDEAKILEDANGKKGSMIFADCLVPDGMAQGAELNLSSILDTMGYDCISKADFIGKEDEYHALIQEVGQSLVNGEYASDGTTLADMYTENTLEIWIATRARDTANGDAPGQWSQHLTFQDTMDRINKFGLGSEGGSLRKTGSLSTNNSKMSESSIDSLNKETEEALNQIKEETEEKNKYNQILQDKKAAYKAEHGEEATGMALQKIEREASAEATR